MMPESGGSSVKAYYIEAGADKIIVFPAPEGIFLANPSYMSSGVVVIYTYHLGFKLMTGST